MVAASKTHDPAKVLIVGYLVTQYSLDTRLRENFFRSIPKSIWDAQVEPLRGAFRPTHMLRKAQEEELKRNALTGKILELLETYPEK